MGKYDGIFMCTWKCLVTGEKSTWVSHFSYTTLSSILLLVNMEFPWILDGHQWNLLVPIYIIVQ
jgi:hypothetical protein